MRPTKRRLTTWITTAVIAVSATTLTPAHASGSTGAADESGAADVIAHWASQFEEAPQGLAAHGSGPLLDPILDAELLAKGAPDECYFGVGDPRNTFVGADITDCPEGAVPKVNQAYVWGLTHARKTLWFGSAPNTHCLVLGAFLGQTNGHETNAWACEFGESAFAQPRGPLPAEVGDWRPARLFSYDVPGEALTERTGQVIAAGDQALLRGTIGIRSAGSLGRMVFLGGPAFLGGINLFAFDAKTGEYLGGQNLPDYDNIRKWIKVRRGLYTAVGHNDGTGRVLRWTGTLDDPFQFEEVGWLDSEGSELAFHKGRLYVTTWPGLMTPSPQFAGLWQSPEVGSGLDATDFDAWSRLWGVEEYEADPVVARTYGGGALVSHGGKLRWGTMHVPFLATVAHLTVYGTPTTTEEALAVILGTHRAISIFEGKRLGTSDQRIKVAYGSAVMPVFDPAEGWTIAPNLMGEWPRYGPAGFGNPFNNYTWIGAKFKGDGYFGTMDWSYVFVEALPLILEAIGAADDTLTELLDDLPMPTEFFGADVWRFDTGRSPAVGESFNGVTNWTNYGMRTVVTTRRHMYLGSANPMNLLTDPADDLPEGGWELISMTR